MGEKSHYDPSGCQGVGTSVGTPGGLQTVAPKGFDRIL